jgi:3-phosphoshikimate 1-carboxyvinyltransferase
LGLSKSKSPIFVGDSGTTLRLILGILAGFDFETKIIAGSSLSKRPMLRVTAPLRMMGAVIKSRLPSPGSRTPNPEEYPPITIKGGNLKPIVYKIPVASAQVKSAVIFAGLYADGETKVIEPVKTRDHTERILKLFKAAIITGRKKITIKGGRELISPKKIYVPGDISSASFFMVLAAIIPGSRVIIRKVSLTPSRAGIIKVLKRMGADIRVSGLGSRVSGGEPMGNVTVKSSNLAAVKIGKEEIPSLIDELPVLMVAACFAKGRSIFEGVAELRVKETDRITSMCENLKRMGAVIKAVKPAGKSENIIIEGGRALKGSPVGSFGDHRTAMSMIVAGLAAEGQTRVDGVECINKSFPGFVNTLKSLLP